ncbi:MAG TPA: hypothetical protein VM820_07145 [Vicinamibacterales bacterium]|nr:hypothetical protein [Vicinamibacterales bacterium]
MARSTRRSGILPQRRRWARTSGRGSASTAERCRSTSDSSARRHLNVAIEVVGPRGGVQVEGAQLGEGLDLWPPLSGELRRVQRKHGRAAAEQMRLGVVGGDLLIDAVEVSEMKRSGAVDGHAY